MEGLIQFTGIVMIAFGILQIILFFKLWGMTNNVKRIWNKIDTENDNLSEACLSYVKGDIDQTEKLLNDSFIQNATFLYKSSDSYEDWVNEYNKLEEKYTKVFNKIGRPLPDFEKYKDRNTYLL